LQIPIFQIDTFTDKVLSGNPAAVCPLPSWLEDDVMQAIAAENNLSETAFFTELSGTFELRWFTPNVEVGLCGHATLAAGEVVLTEIKPDSNSVKFETKSGTLTVSRMDDQFKMDFPVRPLENIVAPTDLIKGLGIKPVKVLAGDDYVAIYNTPQEVLDLNPDLSLLSKLGRRGVVVTAPDTVKDFDYVLRFFAPKNAVPEDPVTGNVQTELVPYWSGELGKKRLSVRQLSARGGVMICEDLGSRISIKGKCVRYFEGEITL